MYTIRKLEFEEISAFENLCLELPAFGAKIAASVRCYGLNHPGYSFWLGYDGSRPVRAMELHSHVLVIVGNGQMDDAVLADFIRGQDVWEIQSSYDQVLALQAQLGGTTDSSWFMEYTGSLPKAPEADIQESSDYPRIFSLLQTCNPFYQVHYTYESWSEDTIHRANRRETIPYLMMLSGQAVATGSVGSIGKKYATVSSVSVLPEFRHRGFGTMFTNFLTREILSDGKIPCLIASSDSVCRLYRQCGFAETRRWGQLFLKEM